MVRRIVSFGLAAAMLVMACAEEPLDPPAYEPAAAGTDDDNGRDAGSPSASDASETVPDGTEDATSIDGSVTDSGGEPTVACTKVAHLGDSLTAYTTDALKAAYAAVSIDATIDAFGGRAINQYCCEDTKTGKQAAASLVASGFDGCWVVALGTNDTANAAVPPGFSRASAIDSMMSTIDPDAKATVMWVNTYTTKTDGYWSNANMMTWNQELENARSRWPNMRILDWASVAATGSAPFSDGIHHTAEGYAVRNAAIAKAASEL